MTPLSPLVDNYAQNIYIFFKLDFLFYFILPEVAPSVVLGAPPSSGNDLKVPPTEINKKTILIIYNFNLIKNFYNLDTTVLD